MSIIHKIVNKHPLDMSKLDTFVSTIDGAVCEKRGKGVFYLWVDGKSTRGFNISLEPNFIEVRNMVLSNRFDYDLTNKIVSEILTQTDGFVINEEEEITYPPLFENRKISEAEIHDCEIIHTLSKENEIAIDGAVRKVHFGKRLYKEFELLKGEQLKTKMFDLILKVNYQIPNFETGNIMKVTNPEDDEPKIMKLLSNSANCIVGKYDNILLYRTDAPIMITNEILNKFLPLGWTLVDEYTIVAPIIKQSDWEKLLADTEKYNLMKTTMPTHNSRFQCATKRET